MVRPALPPFLPFFATRFTSFSRLAMHALLEAFVQGRVGYRRRRRLAQLGVVAADGLVGSGVLDVAALARRRTYLLTRLGEGHQIMPPRCRTITIPTTMNSTTMAYTAHVTGPGGSAWPYWCRGRSSGTRALDQPRYRQSRDQPKDHSGAHGHRADQADDGDNQHHHGDHKPEGQPGHALVIWSYPHVSHTTLN